MTWLAATLASETAEELCQRAYGGTWSGPYAHMMSEATRAKLLAMYETLKAEQAR